MQPIQAIRWDADQRSVRIIDQRRLPGEFVERDLATLEDVREAIRTLAVRGAPALGIAGAMGVCVALAPHVALDRHAFLAMARSAATDLVATRPTAVNLAWAVQRVLRTGARTPGPPASILDAMRAEASAILAEDQVMCRRIGEAGVPLLRDGASVLTHCNAGALATGGIGTALAPIYVAAEHGLRVTVLATETRPLLQGSRLTAWELGRAGIETTIITDSSAAARMRAGDVDLCLVGADRIVANGDCANKIGTYALAVLAHHHGIPFYVAAPTSTIDPSLPAGEAIAIEERDPGEVLSLGEVRVAAHGARARNPAFDVTPAELISAIITDQGIFRPPYAFTVKGPEGHSFVASASDL